VASDSPTDVHGGVNYCRHFPRPILVKAVTGTMEFYDLEKNLGMSYSQLTLNHIFQRGRAQPPTSIVSRWEMMKKPLWFTRRVVQSTEAEGWEISCRHLSLVPGTDPLDWIVTTSSFWQGYPLVNVYITMENHHFFMGKLTINIINGHFQ
jgi:hypothetical protein